MNLVRMSDLETGQTKVVDTSSEEVRKAQYQQMEERTTRLEVLMKQIGAGLIQIKTNESYIDPLRKFFKLRKIRH
jgi:hypothetical protein